MSKINFIGSYSGIDQTMIDSLMEAHKMPLKGLANKKTSITDKQNAWKDINTRLNSLFEKLKNLEKASTFTGKIASSTNDKIVGVTVGSAAPAGKYDIKVNQLASSARIIGGSIPNSSLNDEGELDVEGTFSIKDDYGNEVEVAIDKDMKNVNHVVKAINKAIESKNNEIKEANKELPAGEKKQELVSINATAIGGKLVLSNEETGVRSMSLRSEDGSGVLTRLGLGKSTREDIAGQDAKFNINGADITSKSNKVTDAIEGMAIDLHRAHDPNNPRDYETITVEADIEKASKAVKEFVDQYNSVMRFIEDQTKAGDPEVSGSRGVLAGEGALMRLQSTLATLVTGRVNTEDGSFHDISQLGVSTTDRTGVLSFDAEKFEKALRDDPNALINFFKGAGEKDEDGKLIENGFVSRINKEIDSYISTKRDDKGRYGIIKSTMESYDKAIKDINKQIEVFNERMEKKEAYYIKTFSDLDVAMMQAESQMQWLQGQVDAMNGVKR